jgi:hypothetical protein
MPLFSRGLILGSATKIDVEPLGYPRQFATFASMRTIVLSLFALDQTLS